MESVKRRNPVFSAWKLFLIYVLSAATGTRICYVKDVEESQSIRGKPRTYDPTVATVMSHGTEFELEPHSWMTIGNISEHLDHWVTAVQRRNVVILKQCVWVYGQSYNRVTHENI